MDGLIRGPANRRSRRRLELVRERLVEHSKVLRAGVLGGAAGVELSLGLRQTAVRGAADAAVLFHALPVGHGIPWH